MRERGLLVIGAAAALLGACGGSSAEPPSEISLRDSSPALSTDCTGLMPALPAHSVTSTVGVNEWGGSCMAGTSDGSGTLAAQENDSQTNAADRVTLLSSAGANRGSFTASFDLGGLLHPEVAGFTVLSSASYDVEPPAHYVAVEAFSETGVLTGKTTLVDMRSNLTAPLPDRAWAGAGDPAGGLLAAHVSVTSAGWHVYAQGFDSHASPRGGVQTLAASSVSTTQPQTIYAAMNAGRHALIAWDNGTQSRAVWTDALGHPLSGTFALPQRLTGQSRLVVLLDDSIAAQSSTGWLFRLPSTSHTATPVPSWLATRPHAQLRIVRARRGYMLAFPPATGTCPTSIQFAVFAPAGNRCGGFTLPVPTGTCPSPGGDAGRDGTVSVVGYENNGSAAACVTQFWPALLK